ncbi:class I SAM-dependent methyltransferase [Actinoplanes sp. NPDC024001]|uniref:class I SAM-dependent methyltransferase n=1 Tax=Actinoplanes sp. NPDC024001 TaxID=3154598 RepID=UPI0033F4D6B4
MLAEGNAPRNDRPAHRGAGVYFTEAGAAAPRSVVVDGRRLFRFMDTIYLDRPCEKLSPKKIQVLNAARRPLLERHEVAAVNHRVRSVLARAIGVSQAGSVLEWGCGFHTMRDLFGEVKYSGLDIDPAVVQFNRASAGESRFYLADQDLPDIPDGGFDAVVSAFVFHFRLSRLHIATMQRVLAPGGVLLANVYRRTARSRRELIAEFEQAGMRVLRAPDEAKLCADHEFWCVTHADSSGSERAEAVRAAMRVSAPQ